MLTKSNTISKILCMFALSYILKGKCDACRLFVAGFFCVCTITIYGSEPPCKSVIDLLPFRCKTTGQAEPFFLANNINLSVMSYTEKEVGTCQACKQPKSPTTEELLKEFFYCYNAKEVKETFWRCFITALGSNEMDNWTAIDRSNLAFFYKQLTEFIENLESIHLKTTE